MTGDSALPPIYRSVDLAADADVRAEARRRAEAGCEPATILRADRDDRMVAAVVLVPEEPLVSALLVFHVAVVGLGDALGALMPAGVDVAFAWPGKVLANTAAVGEIRLDAPAGVAMGDVPPWLVVSAEVAIARIGGEDPEALDLSVTSLEDEACFGVGSRDVLAAFARHFLAWVNRWQDDGFEPVRASLLHRTTDHGKEITVEIGGNRLAGTHAGFDDSGGLILESKGKRQVIPLLDVLSG